MDHVEFTARRSLPMMALRGLTVFPGMMLPFVSLWKPETRNI